MDEIIEVKVAKVHEDAQLPTRGSAHAAGYDLYSLEDTEGKDKAFSTASERLIEL